VIDPENEWPVFVFSVRAGETGLLLDAILFAAFIQSHVRQEEKVS
jgi:hypothetical protein